MLHFIAVKLSESVGCVITSCNPLAQPLVHPFPFVLSDRILQLALGFQRRRRYDSK